MKRTILLTVLCLTLALGMAWANPIQGTTNPNAFTQDSIDWCHVFGCSGMAFTSPQSWVSNNGAIGTIGLHNGGLQGFYNFQEGNLWHGNFPSGMGIIYNGFVVNGVQADIRITFHSPVEGVGAYIDGTDFGPFSATITLFNQNSNSLGSFTTDGVSTGTEGTALFIGAYGVGPIFAAQFDATSKTTGHVDFAIGEVKFNTNTPIPEPSTLLMLGSGVFGLAGVIRTKLTR